MPKHARAPCSVSCGVCSEERFVGVLCVSAWKSFALLCCLRLLKELALDDVADFRVPATRGIFVPTETAKVKTCTPLAVLEGEVTDRFCAAASSLVLRTAASDAWVRVVVTVVCTPAFAEALVD